MKSESNPALHIALLSDLYSAYRQILRENTRLGLIQTRLQVCDRISRLSAPRFYVSPLYAKRIINSMSNGTPRASRQRLRLHREIYQRWLSLPESQRTDSALSDILTQPAPSYYLGVEHISRLLYKACKLCQRETHRPS